MKSSAKSAAGGKRSKNLQSRSNEGQKMKSKDLPVKAIIPSRKEPISQRAFRAFEEIGRNLKKTVEIASTNTLKMKRDLKAYFSSDFEVLLLRMTSPTDKRTTEYDLERFLATTETFVRNMDLVSESNPYRITLRKLWNKVTESDGRTKFKALILIHTLLKYSAPDDAMIYKKLVAKMTKESIKKSDCNYFDLMDALVFTTDTDHYRNYVEKYGEYVLKRAKTFTGSFEEMKLIGYGLRTEDICAQVSASYSLTS